MPLLDLNLLATFDALYELRSTTLAADRLGLTQSAVSHALRRLRTAVGDPLFVRGGRALQATARATEMAPAVREGLARLRGAIAPTTFDPATARRTLTIAAGTYFCTLAAGALIAGARKSAPGVTLRLVPLDIDLPESLEGGAIDLAVGAFDTVPPRFRTRSLFGDGFVWIAAAGHPLAGSKVSRDTIDRHPKLQVGTANPFGIPSNLLAGGGIENRPRPEPITGFAGESAPINGVVYDTATAIAAVASSDLLAQVPRRMVERMGGAPGVIILDTVEREPRFDLAAIWHHRADSDGAVKWLLGKLGGF